MVELDGRTATKGSTNVRSVELVSDPIIDLSGRSGSKVVPIGVQNQSTRVQPDNLGQFLSELHFESREKVATLLELMPELE